jgi:hypothetical protein
MRLRAVIGRGVLGFVLVLFGVGVVASPASAASSKCTVKWPSTSCKTSTMRANGTYHRIWYNMCATGASSGADWQIKDADNGVIVGQGHLAPRQCVDGYINGLYGAYWGWVFNARHGAFAMIANDR